jgi:hypothetical protein
MGQVATSAIEGEEKNGAFTDGNCKSGYYRDGEYCRQYCPPDCFRDDGPTRCMKTCGYGRGVGYGSYEFCVEKTGQDCERYGVVWYPKCAANYHSEGCCMCS